MFFIFGSIFLIIRLRIQTIFLNYFLITVNAAHTKIRRNYKQKNQNNQINHTERNLNHHFVCSKLTRNEKKKNRKEIEVFFSFFLVFMCAINSELHIKKDALNALFCFNTTPRHATQHACFGHITFFVQ